MKFISLIIFCFISLIGYSQKNSLAVGANSDLLLESPAYDLYYGFQAKYGLKNRNYILGNVGYSTANITFIGADYSYDLINFSNIFKAYTNAGVGAEFYSEKWKQSGTRVKETYIPLNVQIGMELAIAKKLQIYAGYKAKYYIDEDVFDPNYLNFGVRFPLSASLKIL